jgi:hypothetical protein
MIHALLQNATERLKNEAFTCVMTDGSTTLSTTERGIKPLLGWLNSRADFHQYVAADRVVGKAAAFLYVLLGIRAVYAEIVSIPAAQVLNRYGIPLFYDTQVNAIRNRTQDGFCPMESAVWEIDDPQQAKKAIEETYRQIIGKESI